MQVLKQKTHIDFIGKRRPALFISTALNIAVIVGIAIFGFNWGVDFAGGTVVEMRFNGPTPAEEVRKRAEAGGLDEVSVQQIGNTDEDTFLLRMGGVTQLTEQTAELAKTDITQVAKVTSFRPDLNNGILNVRTEAKVDEAKLKEAVVKAGTGVSEVRFLGEAQGGGFDYQVVASGMADRVFGAMKGDRAEQDFVMQRVDYVGPQVGKQLRNRGVLALVYAAFAILLYIAFRFDFKFAPGALVAMLHDVIMVAGYYLIAGLVAHREFNLTSIAALLTVVGYSVNDTIVIYDRIREEMVKYKGKTLPEIINIAINDTLSRTILTSGVTALSLVGLLIFGVGEIFDFAAAMLVGIVAGTYSSIYIASPLTIWLEERDAKGKTAHHTQARAT